MQLIAAAACLDAVLWQPVDAVHWCRRHGWCFPVCKCHSESVQAVLLQRLAMTCDSLPMTGNTTRPAAAQAPRSILVGNASPELKQWARLQHSMYIAMEPVAAGVMEGLQALGMLETRLPDAVA